MATITLTISAAHTTRLVDAFAGLNNYQDTIDGEANPESKADFAKRMARELLVAQTKRWETKLADDARAEVEEITITE